MPSTWIDPTGRGSDSRLRRTFDSLSKKLASVDSTAASTSSSVSSLQTTTTNWNTWVTWSPSFSAGVTVGNGAWSDARYLRAGGNIVFFEGVFTLGTTSAITGSVTVNLPTTSRYGTATRRGNVACIYNDTGTTVLVGQGYCSVGGVVLKAPGGSSNLSATSPFTWTSTDYIGLSGWYVE